MGVAAPRRGEPREDTTFGEIVAAAGTFPDQRDRFDELDTRRLMAAAHAKLQALGTFDPARHADPAKYPPLTVAEYLEMLALGENISRQYRNPWHVHQAAAAGATWQQIADATDVYDADQVRRDYREWAERQHRLYLDLGGPAGLDGDEHAAAIARAEAGQ